MDPLIKWPGGKSRELKIIDKHIPSSFERYYEPFFGGGAIGFSLSPQEGYVNDIDTNLMNFYEAVKIKDNVFFDELSQIIHDWRLVEGIISILVKDFLKVFPSSVDRIPHFDITDVETLLEHNKQEIGSLISNLKRVPSELYHTYLKDSILDKSRRVVRLQEKHETIFDDGLMQDHLHTAIKSAYYIMVRNEIFNVSSTPATFYFIREFCYGSMFRFNAKGEFNIPYGGKSYNKKDIEGKVNYLKSSEVHSVIDNISFYNYDFDVFFEQFNLTSTDFIFLDPPYDSDFKNYGKNPFGEDDQKRLAEFLGSCSAKWLLVIQKSDLIWDLYSTMNNEQSNISIMAYDKKYTYNVRGRNDRDVSHLLIKNY